MGTRTGPSPPWAGAWRACGAAAPRLALWPEDVLEIDPIAVAGALALTLLAVLATGPGLWSERWGWWWVRKGKPQDDR